MLCMGAAAVGLLLLAVGWALCLHRSAQDTLGPLVQRVDTNAFSLVWWDGAAVSASVEARDARGAVHRATLQHRGRRWLARIEGLRAGAAYTYAIRGRDVAGALTFQHSAEVRTAPAPGGRFSFAVVGDSGDGSARTARLADRILAYRPDLLLHTGDLVYKRGAWADYPNAFFEPFARLAAQVPIYPVLGNHDVLTLDGRPFLSTFDLPRNGPSGGEADRCYEFCFGGVTFVALDSSKDARDLAAQQVPWLDSLLAESSPHWRFAFFHHAPYSAGRHGSDQALQRALVPALERAGIDAVFNGHNHTYVRTAPLLRGVVETNGGIVYVTSGQGGPEHSGGLRDTPSFVEVSRDGGVSFTFVEVADDHLTLSQIDEAGRVLDRVRLVRGEYGFLREAGG